MAYITLLTALAISAVAAYYSIVGLVAIFAASTIPIIIMGSVLEIGKLITASWLYQNWKTAPFLIKSYFTVAVAVLMLITSMGIYGFLSKAHIDQGATAGDATAQIERIEQRIAQENNTIARAENNLAQLDEALDKYIELGAVTKGLEARRDQEPERAAIKDIVDNAYIKIDEYQGQIADLRSEVRAFEVEIGPIKYIAELLFPDSGAEELDKAVRYVILLLIFVFDPLAVLLVIAANMEFMKRKKLEAIPEEHVEFSHEVPDDLKYSTSSGMAVKTKFKEVEIPFAEFKKDEFTEQTVVTENKLKGFKTDV